MYGRRGGGWGRGGGYGRGGWGGGWGRGWGRGWGGGWGRGWGMGGWGFRRPYYGYGGGCCGLYALAFGLIFMGALAFGASRLFV